MSNSKISVVVPIYNAEKYIEKCIESIINQTYKKIEILLINDGSTDNSKSICEMYAKKDNRIKILNQKNGGVSKARKNGIKHSNGQYITFVDADDYIDKEMYEIMIKKIESEKCDIVECGYIFVDVNSNIINEKKPKFELLHGNEACLNAYLKANNCETFLWNKIYKKSLFDNLILDEYSFSEDYLWNIYLFSRCYSKCTINNSLYYYVKNYNGACNSNKNIKKIDGIYAALSGKKYLDENKFSCSNYCLKYALQYCLLIYKEFYYSKMDSKYLTKIYKLFKSNYKLSEIKKIISFTNRISFKLFSFSPKIYLIVDRIYERYLKRFN